MTDGNEWVKSTHGEINTAPAGIGSPRSRMTVSNDKVSPPPAESPAITIFPGSMAVWRTPGGGLIKNKSKKGSISRLPIDSSDKHAASTSWRGHGHGYCGAFLHSDRLREYVVPEKRRMRLTDS